MKFVPVFTSLIVIVFLLAFIILPKSSFSEIENRSLASFPELDWDDIKDGDYMSDVSTYLSDHFPLKNTFVNSKTQFEQHVLKMDCINNIYIGKDGYRIEQYEKPENTEKIVLQYQGGKIPEDQLAPADTELGKRQREYLQNNSRREVTITDPEQIAEILANSASDDMVQINQMAEAYQGINIAVYVSGTEDTGAVSEDDLRDSVNSMEENEIGQTYTVDAGQNVLYDGEYAADYEMDESGQYGIYQRSFRYGKVPEFVKSTFGLTPELMRLNRVFAY